MLKKKIVDKLAEECSENIDVIYYFFNDMINIKSFDTNLLNINLKVLMLLFTALGISQ